MDYDELLDDLIRFHKEKKSSSKEIEMPLKIIDCELKSMVFTEEPRMQVIQYIDILEKSFDELIPDLAHAKHLQFLLEIPDELPRKLLLVATKEMGLLACRYLSSLLNEDEGTDYCPEDNEDDYYQEDYEDNLHPEDDELIGKIPIIKAHGNGE
ncbi:MAG TPA: hypothetical protein GXX58_09320 [Gelria sp.]|jgi:hypothetical protein|nr:hypothetical protein [Gelria sp.]